MHAHLSTDEQSDELKNLFSTAEEMIVHMNNVKIEKAILMSGGETNDFFGKNEEMMTICDTYPDRFAWMCNLDEVEIDTVYTRLNNLKEQRAVDIGELIINKKLNHPFLEAMFSSAEILDLPVLIHMSEKENYKYGVVDEQYVAGNIVRDTYEKIYHKNAERIFRL